MSLIAWRIGFELTHAEHNGLADHLATFSTFYQAFKSMSALKVLRTGEEQSGATGLRIVKEH